MEWAVFRKHLEIWAASSFHDTKMLFVVKAGAFLTNDDLLAEKAMIIREKGQTVRNFAWASR